MLYAKHLLTEKEFNLALSKGVTVFLYNEINFRPKTQDGVQLVNCTTERVRSTWYTWDENERVLNGFKKKYPLFFIWGNYDLTLAFQKALYWSNQKTGFLQYVKNKNFPKEKIWKEDGLYDLSYWRTVLKYGQSLLKYRTNSMLLSKVKKKNTIGIFLKNEFQVTLYKYLILQNVKNENVLFFVMNDSVKNATLKLGVKKSQVVLCSNRIKRKIPLVNCYLMNKEEKFVLNQIAGHWEEVKKWIGLAEQMLAFGISKAVINEGENGVFGAVLGEVFKENGVVSYNTMNGMKSGQAQDSFVNFDYWFVWDDQMKKLLHEKNKLTKDMLLVSGHLMEDEIANYTCQGSFNSIQHENKKVISLFSVRGKREEKMEAFRFLYDLAEQKSDLVLLIRKHPSEKDEDLILPTKDLPNVYWVEYNQENSKNTLYDQLSISDLSICFGSTVALESKWFGVPCITFEKREESLIYCVDDQTIFQVRNKNKFQDYMIQLLNKSKKIKEKEFICNKTATFIIDELAKSC